MPQSVSEPSDPKALPGGHPFGPDLPSDTKGCRPIKCLIWDLDNTLWDGILAEDPSVVIPAARSAILGVLDERGILQSIASRNDFDRAAEILRQNGLLSFFLYPQINWGRKYDSITRIAALLNIGLDSITFVDDDPFERAAVRFESPLVRCFDPSELPALLDLPEFNPVVTPDARQRRQMYLQDSVRREQEQAAAHRPQEEFLTTQNLQFVVTPATPPDLDRAVELTVRTNQLNTTGRTFSHEELQRFISSPNHSLLVAELTDIHGSYGKIGLCLIERHETKWTIKLLLMSCRVMNRSVGSVFITLLIQAAKRAGAELEADFIRTERNRIMYMTYRFLGFRERSGDASCTVLSWKGVVPPTIPTYFSLTFPSELFGGD